MHARLLSRLRPRRPLASVSLLAVFVVVTALGVSSPLSTVDDAPIALVDGTTNQPAGSTTFRIASFNLLGAAHTDGDRPKRRGWANSAERLAWTRQILDSQRIDLVGFQEMHAAQAKAWVKDNPDWTTWPALKKGAVTGHNSVSWRADEFRPIQARLVDIPYFKGARQRVPYVLLEHIASGQRLWLHNVHNPANIGGDHQQWRDEGFRVSIDLVNRLRQEHPNVPVFMTGDMNDRQKFFCPTVGQSELVSASGGEATPTSCTPPRGMGIDWLMGTAPNKFTDYRVLRTPKIKKTSDHPLVVGTANIPSATVQESPIKRVVVMTVDGLGSKALKRLSRDQRAPAVRSMRAAGSSTFNARTAYESTRPLPNLISILSGRPVDKARGGHGVRKETLSGTVHSAAGEYVSSVFDLVHNMGGRTQLLSSAPTSDAVVTTWSRAGGPDPYGPDNGRNKISKHRRASTDRGTVKLFAQGRARPADYTHIHLGRPRKTGLQSGFKGAKYNASVRDLDKNIAIVRRAIRRSPALRAQTMLIVTSTGGGQGRSGSDRTNPATYRVPLLVEGPGVPGGGNLYGLNPSWTSPGANRVPYSATPINTSIIANLTLEALGLPPIPGSSINSRQTFNVLGTP